MTAPGLGLFLVVALGGCGSPPTECCLFDSSAEVVVRGVVRDTLSRPIVRATIRPEVLLFDCGPHVHSVTSVPDSAESDTTGAFDVTVISGDGPGRHCVDLVVRTPGGLVDTVPDLQLEFRHVSVPPDTTSVTLVVDGSGVRSDS